MTATKNSFDLTQALAVVGAAMAVEMTTELRAELADALSRWARYSGKEQYRGIVADLLAGPAAPSEKRQHGVSVARVYSLANWRAAVLRAEARS